MPVECAIVLFHKVIHAAGVGTSAECTLQYSKKTAFFDAAGHVSVACRASCVKVNSASLCARAAAAVA
jgi:hypothetical protein